MSARVKRGVVKYADGESDDVRARRSLTMSSAEKVLRESHLSVQIEVEASASLPTTMGSIAAPIPRVGGVGVRIAGLLVRRFVENRVFRV